MFSFSLGIAQRKHFFFSLVMSAFFSPSSPPSFYPSLHPSLPYKVMVASGIANWDLSLPEDGFSIVNPSNEEAIVQPSCRAKVRSYVHTSTRMCLEMPTPRVCSNPINHSCARGPGCVCGVSRRFSHTSTFLHIHTCVSFQVQPLSPAESSSAGKDGVLVANQVCV